MYTVPDYLEVLDAMIERHAALIEHVIPEEDKDAMNECLREVEILKDLRDRVQNAYVSLNFVSLH